MSWFSKHFGIRLDGHSLGNLLKNASPALAFTPLGAAGAFGASALGDLGRGKRDVGGILRGALTNATIGTGLKAGAGALHHAITPSVGVPSAAPSAFPAIPTDAVPLASAGDVADASAGALAPAPLTTTASTAARSPSFLSKSLNFVKQNPTATAMGLQAIGGLATSGAENARNSAQTDLLRQQYQQTEEDRRKRRELDTYLNRGLTLAPTPTYAGH